MSAILWVLEVIFVGHVVVKYKVTLDQPEDGSPNYEGIANVISDFEEVQEVEIKPLAFGMMYIEVQAVLGEGEGIVDGFEERVKQVDDLVGQIEALEMGRL
ncbi:MAG: hypothetical protein VX057_04555 [Candidatus Thermoplasmatota archaeon]|jgi:translation elongation factor EF-1beta|nr:hypothetical protein [Candidatus Thalassarchaeaceae archaeon]MEC7364540.1 hypothetical protein [Candidatus Thermoplasmatota archaeon]MEC8171575.1 hypothetical protein [Candidatus Thermoplasmatota archaeon]|tara:strand:+ start:610 stop:912 length:303 start_codon:yes stop_codon:yes gene_type:complete